MRLTDKIKKHFNQRNERKYIEEEREYRWILDSIKFGEKSLVVTSGETDIYQIIDMDDSYFFIWVSDTDYVTDFENIPDKRLKLKKNFTVKKSSITSADIGVEYVDKDKNTVGYAEIKLRWSVRVKGNKSYKKQKKSFSFELADDIETAKLSSFFDGAGSVRLMTCDEFDNLYFPKLRPKEKLTHHILLAVIIAIYVLSVLFFIIGLAADNSALSKTMFSICALIPFANLSLHFAFSRYFVFDKENDYRDTRHLDTLVSLCVPMLINIIIIDGMYYELTDKATILLFVITIITALLLFILYWYFSLKETQTKSKILTFAVVALIIPFSSAYILNYTCDTGVSSYYEAVVTDKRVATGGRGGDDYYIEVQQSDKTSEEFSVSYKKYEALQIGDTVTVGEYKGALGLAYSQIEV
ncbi:MAG: hypothetical protein PUB37_01770 [Firmicutes bacterium]|nr:hypothetical protein [Bacillota bacterium]